LLRKFESLPAGAVQDIIWRQSRPGIEHFRGKIRVRPVDGAAEEMNVEFDAGLLTGLEIAIDRSKVNLALGELEFTASREVEKAELKLRDERGQVIHQDTLTFHQEAAGTPLYVRWPPKQAVARIDLRIFDAFGTYVGVAVVPWSVSIPHEEVNFPLDSAVIGSAEKPKLEASLRQINDAIKRHKDIGDISLFIAGHTDTLAAADYNKKLSKERARAIASYFKQRGLPVPIFAYGFGESLPLVPTVDNTDEPRNRRVDYVVAVEPPRNVNWERIK
jgi:outer membrane protein OmpA-like peptidoglycan-associated protein